MFNQHKKFLTTLLLLFSIFLFWQAPATTHAAVKASKLPTRQGILIDLGRHPLTEKSVKSVIQAARDQKLNYVVLHLSDNEHLSFQSTYLGNKASKKVLSKAALKRLVAFAKKKHIQLVPDVDAPSHAGAILRQLKKKRPKTYKQVKMDSHTLDYTKKQSITVVQKIYGELDTIFKKQSSRDFIIGADEVPGSPEAYKSLTTFINQLNRFQNKRGFTTTIWNDSILKSELPRIDKNIVINYWSQAGNRSDKKTLTNRRTHRVSVKNLVNAKRRVVNANSYATYYQLKHIGNKNDDNYFINYLRNHYKPTMFNEITSKNKNSHRIMQPKVKTRGTLVSLWGHNSSHISTQAIVKFIHRIKIPK